MIFDYFIAFCLLLLCFGLTVLWLHAIYEATKKEDDSLIRDILTLDLEYKKDGPIMAFVFYPLAFFVLLLPVVCNYYSNSNTPTEIFTSRTGFLDYAKQNWGKMLLLWLLGMGVAFSFLIKLFTDKRKEK